MFSNPASYEFSDILILSAGPDICSANYLHILADLPGFVTCGVDIVFIHVVEAIVTDVVAVDWPETAEIRNHHLSVHALPLLLRIVNFCTRC